LAVTRALRKRADDGIHLVGRKVDSLSLATRVGGSGRTPRELWNDGGFLYEAALHHPGEQTTERRKLLLNRPRLHLLEPPAHVVAQATLGTKSIGGLEVRNEMRPGVELPRAQRLWRDLGSHARKPTPDELR
jgi:hypothetical protein